MRPHKSFFNAPKMMDNVTKVPSLACIPIDSVVGPCIAIPYDLNALTNRYFIILKTRSAWPTIFVDVMKEGTRNNHNLNLIFIINWKVKL
jgi:hypothetical protein